MRLLYLSAIHPVLANPVLLNNEVAILALQTCVCVHGKKCNAGRIEFEKLLPTNLSSLIIAPIGKSGVLLAGSDTVRGFSRLDQAWITSMADKMEDTFEVTSPSGIGFKKKGEP